MACNERSPRLGLLAASLSLALWLPFAGLPAAGAESQATIRASATHPLPALWDVRDAELERQLGRALSRQGLGEAARSKKLGVALVDLSQRERPRVAAVNGNDMYYAASLPKIAVMLAVFQKHAAGELALDDETWSQLVQMIRRSSNPDSTALMRKVSKPYIADVLRMPQYRLYDPSHGGGLWAGKDYASSGLWRRDPMHNLSHGATAMQVARFFYLLDTGRLVSPEASHTMKDLLGETAIDHKFVKALRIQQPQAAIYRKSGTWRDYHADAALVERQDGGRYIAVGLAQSREGGRWLQDLILVMDRLVTGPRIRAAAGAR